MDNFKDFHYFDSNVSDIENIILSECNGSLETVNQFLIEGLISQQAIQKIFQSAEKISQTKDPSVSDTVSNISTKISQSLGKIKDQVQNSKLVQRLADKGFQKLANSQMTKKAQTLKQISPLFNSIVDQYLQATQKNVNSIPLVTGIFNAALAMKQKPEVIHAFLQQGLETVRNVKESLNEAPFNWTTKAGQWFRNNSEISKSVNANKNTSSGQKPTITKEQLMKLWQDAGSPKDMDDVIQILNKVGFNKSYIKSILKDTGLQFGSARDPKVVALAKIINAAGLQGRILSYIKSQRGITEAIDKNIDLSSIKLTDEQIKKIFVSVTSNQIRAKQQSQNDPQNKVEYYLKQWMRSFQIANQKDKENLVREMVNYWADRKNQPEWKTYVDKLTMVFQHSGLDRPFIDRAIMSLQKGKNLIQLRTLESISTDQISLEKLFKFLSENK